MLETYFKSRRPPKSPKLGNDFSDRDQFPFPLYLLYGRIPILPPGVTSTDFHSDPAEMDKEGESAGTADVGAAPVAFH